ncbi:sigma-70 family RNA polymerase sigma factor [bacterium]|nr:sigma-70 family RNA polymerase sigma factor [bacterium]HPF36280.1 ECF-type sigma factor [Candidatus Krumholzibacteria bacterium]HRX52131.1 ECF-type sigma factor [Candidatus Krumholzibacteria bacterium]
MNDEAPDQVTRWLHAARDGDAAAVDRLLPLVYDELRRLAAARLARERVDHTLQATALVHEAYLRLVDQHDQDWRDRAHFLALAATTIRRVLVDHARRRLADKRGGGAQRLSLTVADLPDQPAADLDLLDLDAALAALAEEKPEHAQVIELRFFGGATAAEAAAVLGVTERTVERRWRFARAWLYRRLADGDAS